MSTLSSSLFPSSSSSLSSLSPSSSKTPTRNPISLRLYKVLGTHFDDAATREALQTLSDLYAAPPIQHTDEDVKVAVETKAESVPGESAARARKHLRRDMEHKLAEGSRQFLRAFAAVDQKLDELEDHILAMHASCDAAEAQLQLTHAASGTLLERAGSLRAERQDVETKKSIVTLFLARFNPSPDEAEALTSRDVPVGPRFFAAMDKTAQIRRDCRVLMAGEDEPSRAGTDIMASTSTLLSHGHEKLFRHCTDAFRTMARDTQVDVPPTTREAVRRLRARPELLTDALSTLAQTRGSTLQRAFQRALTAGPPRPIELHAHDPLRYVGDMLAWVHQAVAAEREFVEALFGMRGDGRMVGSVRIFRHGEGEGGEEEEWGKGLMDGALGGVCAPLKVRVGQTVRSQESCIVAYKIANLLQFYMLTMRRTIGAEALLSRTLSELTDGAYGVFYEAIEAQGRALLRGGLEDPNDPAQTPPPAILDHLQILREIMAVYHSAPDESPSPDDDDETEPARILDVMLTPALELCTRAGAGAGFVLGCLGYIQSVLEPYAFTAAKRADVQGMIDERVEQLTEEHYDKILNDSGLAPVVDVCEHLDLSEPMSHIPATSPPALRHALHAFAQWLARPEAVQSAEAHVPERIHRAALVRVARAYTRVCAEVRRPENRYEAGATIVGGESPFGRGGLLGQILGLGEGEEGE